MKYKNNNLKKNIGLIGYGSIGKIHHKNLLKLGYKVFIYDPLIKNLKINNLNRINKNCNSVVISSPSYTHFKYLNYFIKKNKNIFIEKPFAHKVKNTVNLINKANKKKLVVAINYNLRVRKSILILKKFLSKIKKIYWAKFFMSSDILKWRKNYNFNKNYTHNKIAGGIVFDSIHEIDLNTFLFKKVIYKNSILRNLNKKKFKNSTYANINLEINNKFNSNIQLDYHGKPEQRKLEILTNLGLLKVDIKKNIFFLIDKNNNIKFSKKFNVNKNIDYLNMIKNFISCIKNKKYKPICGPQDAIRNILLVTNTNER